MTFYLLATRYHDEPSVWRVYDTEIAALQAAQSYTFGSAQANNNQAALVNGQWKQRLPDCYSLEEDAGDDFMSDQLWLGKCTVGSPIEYYLAFTNDYQLLCDGLDKEKLKNFTSVEEYMATRG